MQLHFIEGDFAGQDITIADDRYRIGRADGNDLRIPDHDKRSSRRHAEIARENGHWVIRDLDSANGVHVDGRRITAATVLRDGQTIRIGAQHASVRLPAAAETDRGLWAGRRPDSPAADSRQGSGRPRSYTLLIQRANQRLRILGTVAGAAVLLAVAAVVLAVTGVFSSGGGIDVAAIVRDARPSTVLVDMRIDPQALKNGGITLNNRINRSGTGSGWVLDAERGLIVTNAHVAVGGQHVKIALPGEHARDARVVGVNLCQDTALVQTSDTSGLRTMPQVSQSELDEGDPVVAIGFPATLAVGDNLVTTTGVISIVKARGVDPSYPNVVQTDAAINSGNSGGPLLNEDGRLVGMNTYSAAKEGKQNQNYAIATDHINELLGDLRGGGSAGWIGYELLWPEIDEPDEDLVVVTDSSTGTKYYGPQVIGRADLAPTNQKLVGLAGGKQQWIVGIDGHRFGPGGDQLSLFDEDFGMCPVTADKRSGETSTLSVVEHDPTSGFTLYDVKVTYP